MIAVPTEFDRRRRADRTPGEARRDVACPPRGVVRFDLGWLDIAWVPRRGDATGPPAEGRPSGPAPSPPRGEGQG